MVKKEREYPVRLQLEEALLRCLPIRHSKRKKIEDHRLKNNAGYNGEKELDYHLNYLPDKEFYIFQNLCLPNFQLDAFVLCSRFGVIVESKNISGTLNFQHGFSRQLDGKKDGFPDPSLQVQRHQIQLEKWLLTQNLKPFPVYGFVAISFPSTIIESPLPQHLYHAERIPSEILKLQRTCPDPVLSFCQLNQITDLLLSHHQLPKIDILQIYDLHPKDFISGISCPQCKHRPMTRIQNSGSAKSVKKNPHLLINRLFLIIYLYMAKLTIVNVNSCFILRLLIPLEEYCKL